MFWFKGLYFVPLIWDYPSIEPFWARVQYLLHQVLRVWIPFAYLLNVPKSKLSRKNSRLLLHSNSSQMFNCNFLGISSPSSLDLYTRSQVVRTVEHLTALLNNKINFF